MSQPYPRAAVRRLLRQHCAGLRVGGGVDTLVYLDYVLFLERVGEEAVALAEAERSRAVEERHARAAMAKVMAEMDARPRE